MPPPPTSSVLERNNKTPPKDTKFMLEFNAKTMTMTLTYFTSYMSVDSEASAIRIDTGIDFVISFEE